MFLDLPQDDIRNVARFRLRAPDSRAGGGAPEMGSRLSTLATCGFEIRTSLEATTG